MTYQSLYRKYRSQSFGDLIGQEATARALAKVRHPNIVSVYGVETYDDHVGLCMEFVRGQTLEDVLGVSGTMSGLEAALIGVDVCRALAAVHARCAAGGRIARVDLDLVAVGKLRRCGRLHQASTP